MRKWWRHFVAQHLFLAGAIVLLAIGSSTALAWQQEPARLDAPPTSKKLPPASAEQPAAAERDAVDVRSASFKNVRPGQTTAQEARRLLGEPARVGTEDGSTVWTYRIEPFAKVDLHLTDGVAASVVIHLKKATPAAQMAKEMGIEAFRPTPIPDENGQLLGIAYPERGVIFGLLPDVRENPVSQVFLEAAAAEPFVLRVLYDFEHRYQSNLADLSVAAKLDPLDARVPCLEARVLAAVGRREEALAKAAEAVRLDPASAAYRLTYAWLLGETGAHERGIAETRTVLAAGNVPKEAEARAECLLGDLLAGGPAKNYKDAIVHHQAAVKLATALAADRRFAVRRTAKQVLVDAHLGVAHDVAHGPFKRKGEVVPKWLAKADSLAQDYLENDRGDSAIRLLVARRTLAALAGMQGEADATAAATLAQTQARKLVGSKVDPLFVRQIAWELGQALCDAARIEQDRGQPDKALAYIERAVAPLEQDIAEREPAVDEQYLLGRLYFLAGSVLALEKENHSEAVKWYNKAAPRLSESKAGAAAERGLAGERFVSMGVSYWQAGAKEEAVRLTREGAQLMQEAVGAGTLSPSAMAVPFGNLASMCRSLGQETQATEYATLADKSAVGDAPKRR